MKNNLKHRLGCAWSFPLKFSTEESNSVKMVQDYTNIHQSLKVLLSTIPGERIMRVDYGCDLNIHMFENINDDLSEDIERTIRDSVLRCEPRVEIQSVVSTQDEEDITKLNIQVRYKIRGTDEDSFIINRSFGTMSHLGAWN